MPSSEFTIVALHISTHKKMHAVVMQVAKILDAGQTKRNHATACKIILQSICTYPMNKPANKPECASIHV